MVKLTDPLERAIGAKSAKPLAEHLDIHTVDDLLRHYPRKYSDGMSVLEEGDQPEEGEHITFVDVISKSELKWTNRSPRREYMVVTLGNRTPKVTATFFNVKYLKKSLKEGSRVMLSGEVGYFKGTLQLTHPAFLVLHESGEMKGSKSLQSIAEASGSSGEDLLAAFQQESERLVEALSRFSGSTAL